jgi:hypothetical protein
MRSENGMKKKLRLSLILLSILFMSIIFLPNAFCFAQPARRKPGPFRWDFDPEDVEKLRRIMPVFLSMKTIVNVINSIVILGLVIIHLNIYRRTGSEFSIGLVIFSTALLLYTIISNPLVHQLVGFRRIGFGPLLLIPDVFSLLASAVLLYLSRK